MADIAPRRADPRDFDGIVAVQRASYARNEAILGVVPIPLQADYAAVLATSEVWCLGPVGAPAAVLILEPHADHLLIWSIAADPAQQGQGQGRHLLAFAETRAREIGLAQVRLYTGTLLVGNVAWYGRHGFVVDRVEQRPDRSVTHMSKSLVQAVVQATRVG